CAPPPQVAEAAGKNRAVARPILGLAPAGPTLRVVQNRSRRFCARDRAGPGRSPDPALRQGVTVGLPMLLLLSILWLALVTWLIARAVRQRNVLAGVAVTALDPGRTAPKVAVIVPARNEAANIGRCVESLSAQDYPPDRLALIVVDDDSSDDTAAIVTTLARRDPRIILRHTPPLPPGWKGKVHACCVGTAAAPADAQWLCFLDADMRAAPRAIASAVAAASDRKLDLLTLAPRHELKSFAERLMLPCGLYLLGFYQNLGKIQAPQSDQVVATGQFMLIRRTAYEAIGGHAPVRGAICEDVELALLMKRSGYRVLLMDGNLLLTT